MSVSTDINKILQIKKDIHTAIKNKGVNIPNNTPFGNYSTEIGKITGGGSGGDYPYNCFNGSVQTSNDSVSYLNVNFNPTVLPDYSLYNGESQYVLMPLTNQYLGEDGKYKKVKVGLEYKSMYGCINYEDDGSAKSVKAYCVKGQEDKIVLGNRPSIVGTTIVDLGNVSIPAHDLYDYTVGVPSYDTVNLVGNTQLDLNTGIISNFSAGNYANLPVVFNPGNNTWEFQVKFMPTHLDSSIRVFTLGGAGVDHVGVVMQLDGGYYGGSAKWWIASGTGGWNIANNAAGQCSVTTNTIYYYKIQFTGDCYKAYQSTDGKNWTEDFSRSSTTPVGYVTLPAAFGTADNISWYYFNGNIYLDGCYLKIGNEVVWSGLKQDVGWTPANN